MTPEQHKPSVSPIQYVALTLAIAALALAVFSLYRQSDSVKISSEKRRETALDKARAAKRIRVGYGPFPPYTMVDPDFSNPEKALSGYCVDMVREIAKRQEPPWTVEWVPVSWETLRAEIYSGKVDFVANAIYQTVPRAPEFSYSLPFTYIGVGVAIVRKGDRRFKQFNDLNLPSVTISLAEGWVITGYARKRLPNADLLVKPVSGETNIQFQDLIAERADVVLTDVPVAASIYENHRDSVDILWLEAPPIRVPACFMTRKGESDTVEFLNICISAMQADGTLDMIDKKWGGMGEYTVQQFRPGTGLEKILNNNRR